MKTKKEKRIIEENGTVRVENGPDDSNLALLSQKPELLGFDIFSLVRKEEEIYKELLLNLECDLKGLLNEISSVENDPSEEFELLFKQLHRLFKQKPYYLTLILDKDLQCYYSEADPIISRIKGVARGYLAGLIDRGKAQNIFIINTETKVLVKEILDSFQALMNEMQLTDKMVRDLKKYQSAKD